MTRIHFQEVIKVKVRSGKCEVCGKRVQQKKKFSQTLNPFNKNSVGAVKSKAEILQELSVLSDAWLVSPLVHDKCK